MAVMFTGGLATPTTERVRADVKTLVELQDDGDRAVQPLLARDFAIHRERAGPALTDPGDAAEGERGEAQAVVLEVELPRVLAGRERDQPSDFRAPVLREDVPVDPYREVFVLGPLAEDTTRNKNQARNY
jgi:hypothetical protein